MNRAVITACGVATANEVRTNAWFAVYLGVSQGYYISTLGLFAYITPSGKKKNKG